MNEERGEGGVNKEEKEEKEKGERRWGKSIIIKRLIIDGLEFIRVEGFVFRGSGGRKGRVDDTISR
jgi:hypothetical protein